VRVTRIHFDRPLSSGAIVSLSESAAAHVSRVLRLGPGDVLTLFDGRGGEYPATIVDARGIVVRVQAGECRSVERESPLSLTLVQGVSRGERMDWVVQKATELGVAEIIPVLTERSVVKLNASQAERKRDHWLGIAISACEQCGRNRVPRIHIPLDFANWLVPDPNALRIMLDVSGSNALQGLQAHQQVTLLIGPEGGLANSERDAAIGSGFRALRLGPRTLRTETAAVAALAALQLVAGDLGLSSPAI
jgi:16S rRNA (uracil1498-N3)-methyltransferase